MWDIVRLWDSDAINDSARARNLPLMIARIVATQHGTREQLNVEIHWQSGPVSRIHVCAPARRLEQLPSYEALRRRIPELDKECRSRPETVSPAS